MVAAGTKLVGDLTLTDSLHLDGRIQGTLRSEGDFSIGQSGRFDGDVEARRVLVSGRLEGTVVAERLEIVSGGRVHGEIQVNSLVIESGGQFNGTSQIRSPEAPRQLGYAHQPPAGECGRPVAASAETAVADRGVGKTGNGT